MKESKERYRLFIVYMFSPGFVGLVVPPVTRLYLGSNYRHLLPLSFLNGGTFLVLADLIARTVITPCELPIGVITALPAFAVLFIRKYRS